MRPGERSTHRSALVAALIAASAGTVMPASVWAQEDVTGLAAACVEAGGAQEVCLDAALGLQAAHGLVGLAVAGGSDLPGNSSTLGMRLGSTPRFVLGARVGLARGDLSPTSDAPGSSESSWVRTLQASVAAGLFDGFSPAPTVGGILAVDVFGTAFHASLPNDAGLDGSTSGFGLGLRLGIFRESFTLPGVTLSVARRWLGDVEMGSDADVDRYGADFDLDVTSLRATVGKELLAIAFVAGVGWDRYASDARLEVDDTPSFSSGSSRLEVPGGDVRSDRTLFFGSASYTFLILQLTAEGGYARGFAQVPGAAAGAYDPTSGSLFIRVGGRLTL